MAMVPSSLTCERPSEALDFPELPDLFALPDLDAAEGTKETEIPNKPSWMWLNDAQRAYEKVRCARIRERIQEMRARDPAMEPREALRALRQDDAFANCKSDVLIRQVRRVFGRTISGIKQKPLTQEEDGKLRNAIAQSMEQLKQENQPVTYASIHKRVVKDFQIKRSLSTIHRRIVTQRQSGGAKRERLTLQKKEELKEHLRTWSVDRFNRTLIEIREELKHEGYLPRFNGVAVRDDLVKESIEAAIRTSSNETIQNIKEHLTAFLVGDNKACSYEKMRRELFANDLIPESRYNLRIIKIIAEQVRAASS